MEADFSGYATKNGLKCADGRIIHAGAFKDDDKKRIPLVWQHQHDDTVNVLGHAILENRDDGVYAYGFFNDSESGTNAKILVQHGDITALSIYANNLIEKNKNVVHGAIRELSLVLSGANPGALIDNVSLAHGDSTEVIEDEAIIYTGLELEDGIDLEHSGETEEKVVEKESVEEAADSKAVLDTLNDEQQEAVYGLVEAALAHTSEKEEDTSDEDPLADLTDEQQAVVDQLLSDAALSHADAKATTNTTNKGATVAGTPTAAPAAAKGQTLGDIFNTLTDLQKQAVYAIIGEAVDEVAPADTSTTATHSDIDNQEGSEMSRNVFDTTDEKESKKAPRATLSHSQLKEIVEDGVKMGSLKDSFFAHAEQYGITDIDLLFPDAQNVSQTPDFISRRMDWVQSVIGGAKHSPFSRIKSTAADITADEARAKGYVKASLKKTEVINLLQRVTTPTTVYKKQKLDRDDIVDITDLDVVTWLKGEMRLMLDEEIGRAVLVGDGREPDDPDKINELNVRPIAFDDEMYAHQVTLPSNVEGDAIVEGILRARTYYKGTGTPTLYTTDSILTDLILLKDKIGRRLYNNEVDLAAALRVSTIVVVEVMEDVPDLLAIVVNIADYTIGADAGGAISMFDDFDIDYNQYKYLIETRISGALTKPKSAIVIKRTAGNLVTPTAPTYNPTTHVITFPTIAGVNYQVDGVTKTGTLTITETTDVESVPADGYSFPHNIDTDWNFPYTA